MRPPSLSAIFCRHLLENQKGPGLVRRAAALGRYSFLTWVACSDEDDDDISPNNLSLPPSAEKCLTPVGPPQKFFFAFPFFPSSLFRFVTLSAVAWGTAKARADPDGFGRTEEQMQSQSSRRRSGPAAATASEGASGQARRRKGTERSFSVRIMKATAQRSVCVCEQGGGPTGLGLSILGGIRGSMRQCASSPLVARTRRRRQLARMGQMFCQLCAAKKDIDCAAIHSRMEWPKRRRGEE